MNDIEESGKVYRISIVPKVSDIPIECVKCNKSTGKDSDYLIEFGPGVQFRCVECGLVAIYAFKLRTEE